MKLVITCISIFFARILDVSLGSLRIIFLGKEKAFLAFVFGFLEIFVWFMVARDAIVNGDNWWIVISYCLGYAVGTYVGSLISERYVKGTLGVQIVTTNHDARVIENIRKSGYAVSAIDVKGKNVNSSKYMLFIEVNKKKFDGLKKIVRETDPQAFIVVNDTKYVQNGYFK